MASLVKVPEGGDRPSMLPTAVSRHGQKFALPMRKGFLKAERELLLIVVKHLGGASPLRTCFRSCRYLKTKPADR